MTFFKNNNKNTPYHPFIEFIIITISLIVILVPLSPKQKIIFLSAYGQRIIEQQESRRDEFLQIIQKPFSLEFLYEKIKPKSFTTLKRSQVNDMLTITQSPETIR